MMTVPSDPVAAIVETDAGGQTATIFADIRETLGVEVVNLIWRHLATMPGVLEWDWGELKPLYRRLLRRLRGLSRGSMGSARTRI